jgi:hypothetical protein
VKDQRPGHVADVEDGANRTIIAIEPGLNGKPRLAIEGYTLTGRDFSLELAYRTTISADAALALAAGIQNQLGDQQ